VRIYNLFMNEMWKCRYGEEWKRSAGLISHWWGSSLESKRKQQIL